MKWLSMRRSRVAAVPSSDIPDVAVPEKSLWNLDGADLLDLVALPKPVPGCGSVAIVTGCLGTALLRKALAVSRGKARLVDKAAPLDELNRLDRILRGSADLDAIEFDYYIRALRLPRSNPVEKKIREKAVEQTLVRATSIPINAAAVILRIVSLALGELPSIETVVLSEAVAGIRLLNTSARCLLYIAEGNLKKVTPATLSSMLTDQLEALNSGIRHAESELMRFLGRSVS
jgi:formiminotetrahydrofolate cyclodeaminase